jgi:hypothetical protein
MTVSTSDRQHGRALNALLGKGLIATSIGVAFVLAPQLLAGYLRPFGPIESLAMGIRICGLILLLIGIAALGVRHSVRNRMDKLSVLRRTGGGNDRMNYLTRGAPLGSAQGFPLNSEASQKTVQPEHARSA